VSDKLTIDRNAYKGHLESLADDTARMLDRVSTTRASYASVQKDANARLIVRIEKAVRESRKLRVAAEQQAELEGPAMRDIRVVLDTARNSCLDIVASIKETCLKQLWVIEPLRAPHREKMEARVRSLKASWADVESVLLPLVEDYRREVYKHLALTKSQCMNIIGKYRENETAELRSKYTSERAGLINAFRRHFREYDLSEAAIFERFNREVLDTVAEMNLLWGPSRPKFITQGITELDNIVNESLVSGYADVTSNMYTLNTTNDDFTMARMEICDLFTHSLSKSTDYARAIPVQYVVEKKNQLVMIDEMSMEKNGDMVRPQVKAVLDLLLSGIEIDSDFGKGYVSLVDATTVKAGECHDELVDFNDRYANAVNPLSIDYSASLTLGRIDQRRQEVVSLIDASNAHLVADHSRLDVLLSAGTCMIFSELCYLSSLIVSFSMLYPLLRFTPQRASPSFHIPLLHISTLHHILRTTHPTINYRREGHRGMGLAHPAARRKRLPQRRANLSVQPVAHASYHPPSGADQRGRGQSRQAQGSIVCDACGQCECCESAGSGRATTSGERHEQRYLR